MAPIDQSKSTSSAKKPSPAPIVDDDDKWTDLVPEKEGKDSPAQTDPATPFPLSTNALSRNTSPMYLPTPINYGLPDSLNRTLPTQQMKLEAEVMHLAEVELGVMNAVHILEKHVLNARDRNMLNDSYELSFSTNYSLSNPGRISTSPASRSFTYSTERQQSTSALRDMSYLIGLGRAVKILKEAVADKDRKDATYSVRVAPLVPPPPPQMPSLPMYVNPPSIQSPSLSAAQEKEFRNIAKEIVKESVREYKDTVVGPSMEEVQQELIKLCRDVCREALHRKD
jgi:hypothetical protein